MGEYHRGVFGFQMTLGDEFVNMVVWLYEEKKKTNKSWRLACSVKNAIKYNCFPKQEVETFMGVFSLASLTITRVTIYYPGVLKFVTIKTFDLLKEINDYVSMCENKL